MEVLGKKEALLEEEGKSRRNHFFPYFFPYQSNQNSNEHG